MRWGSGMAVPKGRALSAAYVRSFVENAKSEDLVKGAIERAELRGVIVAPLASILQAGR
jgi:polar amino acid transport system substrate-binding protein